MAMYFVIVLVGFVVYSAVLNTRARTHTHTHTHMHTSLRDVACIKGTIFLVFDYASQDLSKYIKLHRSKQEGIGVRRSKVGMSNVCII